PYPRELGKANRDPDEGLVVGHEAAIAAQPGECALDHAAAAQDLEAARLVGAFDDFQLEAQPTSWLASLGPAQPPSAKIFLRRGHFWSALSIRPAALSRSWIFTGITSSERTWPSVSTSALRLLPLIFLPAS